MADNIKIPELDLEVDPKDKKYYVEKPDPNFSVQRNLAVIAQVDREADEFFRKQDEEYKFDQEDRIDVLGTYGRYRFNKGTKGFEDWAGRKLYTRLIGEKILSKYRALSSIDKLRGRTKVLI